MQITEMQTATQIRKSKKELYDIGCIPNYETHETSFIFVVY